MFTRAHSLMSMYSPEKLTCVDCDKQQPAEMSWQLIWQVLSLHVAHQSAHSEWADLLLGKARGALNPMSACWEAACHSSVAAGCNVAAHLELPNHTQRYYLQHPQSHQNLLVWHRLFLLQFWHSCSLKSEYARPEFDTLGHPPASTYMGLTAQTLTAW